MARLRDAKHSFSPPNVRAWNLRVEMEELQMAVTTEVPQRYLSPASLFLLFALGR
jgi:hypothetical protein